ncbi:hypothetical protein [Sphingobacterium lumbrici]|uniref:hypothetical protein n=1 Tax=Sphingobacterium lumbrici TaxID=2559600 RepID=UPI00112D4670|nr:hypothetical protein [Sphingobacterium lumbrici]
MNKKFSLKNLNIKEVEQLSRTQLRNVLGGFTGGTGPTETDATGTESPGSCTVTCPSGLYSCTSPTGDCTHKTHNDEGVQVISIACDGISYKC